MGAGDRSVAYSDLMPARTRQSLEIDAALRELFLSRVGPNRFFKAQRPGFIPVIIHTGTIRVKCAVPVRLFVNTVNVHSQKFQKRE